MRAAVVPRHGPPEVIEVRSDWPEPEPPGPGEVLIQVQAAGLNPSDTKIRAGGGRAPGQVELPYVTGREAAGRVLQLGAGVEGLSVGQEVFAFFGWGGRPGGHAERLAVAASAVAGRPPGTPLTEAAGLPLAGLTALQALDTLDPEPGEAILITSGSGGVGHLAVQLAAARGLEVIATAGPANRSFVENLGAAAVLDYGEVVSPGLLSGVRYMVDSVGGENIAAYQDQLAADAHVAAVAGVPRAVRDGVRISPIRCRASAEELSELAELMGGGRLSVTVQEVFPLEHVAEAHRLLEARHVRGKLVIEIGP